MTDEARSRLVKVVLDRRMAVYGSADVEHERRVAIQDLLTDNRFALKDGEEGPFSLHLSVAENRLVLDIRGADESPRQRLMLSLTPFRRIVKDYFLICESYYQAVKTAAPARIEALDMGRRTLHDEGSEILYARLKEKVDLDFATARRLFTLICVLQFRG